MYGQMTAGSWIYIGTQGILQGTYETLAALAAQTRLGLAEGQVCADRRAGRDGRRPAAGDHHERGRRAVVEVDPARAKRRLEIGYVDVVVDTLEEAMTLVEECARSRQTRARSG